jgi:hypothetical protein
MSLLISFKYFDNMRFATRDIINEGLKRILRNSKKQILIVTPYIK